MRKNEEERRGQWENDWTKKGGSQKWERMNEEKRDQWENDWIKKDGSQKWERMNKERRDQMRKGLVEKSMAAVLAAKCEKEWRY